MLCSRPANAPIDQFSHRWMKKLDYSHRIVGC